MKLNIKNLKVKLSSLLKDKEENIRITVLDQSSSSIFTIEEFFNHFNPEEIQKGHCHFIFCMEHNGMKMASWVIKDMIGCAGILIYTDLFVRREYCKIGLGTAITEFIPMVAKNYGYGIIQATDIETNPATSKIMRNSDWVLASRFKNNKTNNIVCLWFKNISVLENE